MKREFLQNLKAGDAQLPKEVIDAIMAENGRDIEEAKKPFSDYDTIKTQLGEAQKTIKGFQDQDIDGIKRSAAEWEQKYKDAVAAHEKQMADAAFDGVLKDAITAAKGRNDKAIRALLDIETLKASKNQAEDIKTAVEGLKKDSGYLFETEQTPPPYSFGAGTRHQHSSKYDDLTASIRAAAGLKIDD